MLLLTSALFVSISFVGTPPAHGLVLVVTFVGGISDGKSGDIIRVTATNVAPTTPIGTPCSITDSSPGHNLVTYPTMAVTIAGQADGSFKVGTTAAPAGGGTYTVTVSCPATTPVDSGIASFTVDPSITVSPPIGVANQLIKVTGLGFWSDQISCGLTGGAVLAGSAICNMGGGSMTGQFIVDPGVADGPYSLVVTPSDGVAEGAVTFLNVFQKVSAPTIFIASPLGAFASPGFGTMPADGSGRVIVTGGGFATSASPRSCDLLSPTGALFATTPATYCSISPAGTVTALFAVSKTAPTFVAYTVRVRDAAPPTGTGWVADTTFFVSSPPVTTPFPATGIAGDSISVFAGGFPTPEDDGVCTIKSNSPNLIASQICSIAFGTIFFGAFVVSDKVPGSPAYTVWVETSRGDFSAPAPFQVLPSVTLDVMVGSPPVTGPPTAPATEVNVKGTGFSATDTGCTITGSAGLNVNTSGEPACKVTLGTGQLTAKFKVGANSLYGFYGVTVQGTPGLDPPFGFTVWPFNVVPQIALSVPSGGPTTLVNFAGSGFTPTPGSATNPCAQLAAPFGLLPTDTCSQDVNGNVVGSFTVPIATGSGSYSVIFTDFFGFPVASKTFIVTGGPIISLSPNSGPTGQVVQVDGTGFNLADVSVSIWDGGAGLFSGASPFTCTVQNGAIVQPCKFTVKSTAPGVIVGYSVTATGTTHDISSASFLVLSTLVLDPGPIDGGPGALVHFKGSGYVAGWGGCVGLLGSVPGAGGLLGGPPICNIDPNGILDGQFLVQASVGPGAYAVSLTGAPVVQGAVSATFTLTSPSIALVPDTGSGGDTIQITGTGFSSGDSTCSVSGTANAIDSWTCHVSGGVVTGSFVVKTANNPAGVKTISVAANTGDGATFAGGFSVVPQIVHTLTPNPARVGDTVDVTGTNFGLAGPCGIFSPAWAATNFCNVNPDFTMHGQFVLLVALTGLSFPVTVTDGTPVSATATLNIIPIVIVLKGPDGTASGPAGASISVTGTGFALSDVTPCMILLDGAAPAISTCAMGPGGTVSGSFTIPVGTTSGAHVVTVTGTGGDSGTAPLTVAAGVTLVPNTGRAGTIVQVSGTGFAAGDSGCGISSSPTGLISTPPNPLCSVVGGVVSGSFVVGGVTGAVYTVTVTGSTGDTGTAKFTVPAAPTLTLLPNTGGSDTGVSATGNFYAGTQCNLIAVPSTLFTSQSCSIVSGALTGGFTVAPSAVPGTAYTVTATTNAGGADSASATFIATVGPTNVLTLTPTSGPIGTVVSGAGPGFTADTMCQLSATPTEVLSSPTCVITAGKATVGFTVSMQAAAGTYNIVAVGNTGRSATGTFTLTAGPTGTLTLTPTSGAIVTVVSGVGTGFTADKTCQLSAAPAKILSSPSCVITAGVANVGFEVSRDADAGTYTIFVLGSAGTSASATFVVTSGAQPSFSISTNPSTITINLGGIGTVTITVLSIGSFSSPVTLSVPTLPLGITGGFSSSPVTPPAGGSTSSVLSLTVSNTAPTGNTILAVAGTAGGLTSTASLTLIIPVTTTATTATTSATTSVTTVTTGPWTPPKCVIATATFGSEAAPAVQFLRGFRDNLVLKTQAGSAFMQVFNAWYYSFSPSVAQFIASNDPIRAPVRVVLYPLLGVLGISAFTYSLFSATPESAIVMAGLVASSLIGLVYLTPFTLVGMRSLTRRKRINTISLAKASLLVLVTALGLLAAGELAGSFLMLAVASSAIVLTCIIAAPTIIALLVLRPKPQ